MAKKLIPPTKAEDKKINRGIALDRDTFEATAEDFARANPAKDVLPAKIYEAVLRRGSARSASLAPRRGIALRILQQVFTDSSYSCNTPSVTLWESMKKIVLIEDDPDLYSLIQ